MSSQLYPMSTTFMPVKFNSYCSGSVQTHTTVYFDNSKGMCPICQLYTEIDILRTIVIDQEAKFNKQTREFQKLQKDLYMINPELNY